MNNAVREEAFKIRIEFQEGRISYKEAKEKLAEYKELYDEIATKLALKHNCKPQKLIISDFLKSKVL